MIREFQGDHRFLSNFWPAVVHLDGTYYPSVEHAYQAAKFVEPARRTAIRNALTPGEAKKLARMWVTTTPDWDTKRVVVMDDLLRQKFKHANLRKLLLATGTQELQEGNTWNDRYWGVDLRTGTGENTLGKLLMKIREEARG